MEHKPRPTRSSNLETVGLVDAKKHLMRSLINSVLAFTDSKRPHILQIHTCAMVLGQRYIKIMKARGLSLLLEGS